MPGKEATRFDWDSYWLHEAEGDQMRVGAENMAARITKLISSTDASSVADVGCGCGRTITTLAMAHPDLWFVGYDTSPAAVRRCERRARAIGLTNLRFMRGSLPALAPRGRFDIVLCIATLHYVKDVRAALGVLWSMVTPGGSLVFNYPNKFTMHAYRRWVAQVDDPTLSRRFALLLAGENLLTLKEVQELLGARPLSLWRLMGEATTPANVCVVVRRSSRSCRCSPRESSRKPS